MYSTLRASGHIDNAAAQSRGNIREFLSVLVVIPNEGEYSIRSYLFERGMD